MAEGLNDSNRSAESESEARSGYRGSFKQSGETARLLNKIIAVAVPIETPAGVAALFDGRANASTIRGWRNGFRNMPPWAIEMLRARRDAFSAALADLQPGPGSEVTRRNLTSWLAKQNLK